MMVSKIRCEGSGRAALLAGVLLLVAGGTVLAVAFRPSQPETRRVAGVAVEVQPAMGAPLSGLSPGQLDRFLAGRVAFDKEFSPAEGLGPVFNQTSCGNCHLTPLGGSGSQTVTRFGSAGKGGFDPLGQLGGSLLQAEAISAECGEDVPPEANVTALRLTNPTLGFGLVEAIPDADIQYYQDNPPSAEVSGRVHWVPRLEDPASPLRAGRFGWKSQLATVLSFSGDASLMEMGITNRIVGQENDPNGINPPLLADCDMVPDPEDHADAEGVEFIDRVTDFQRFLSNPPQTPKSGMTGEALFISIGCADCHVPSYSTPDSPELEDALRNKTLQPYSDFLLHDMGLAADFIPQGDAGAQELRTPLLWGLRVRDPLWHDGRAPAGTLLSRVVEAIRWHCALLSEARPSAQRFLSGLDFTSGSDICEELSGSPCPPCDDLAGNPCPCAVNGVVAGGLDDAQRAQVIAFLDSLGKIEFDSDGDGFLGLDDDLSNLKACSEIDVVITPDDPCAVHDINQDGVIDETDFEGFAAAFGAGDEDCNCNGVNDLVDILNGTSLDANGDGVPDECAAGDTPLCAVTYALDIRSGKCPNKFKLTTGGGDEKLYIAGSPDSDVHLIDLSSIRLRLCGADESIAYAKEPRFKDKVTPLSTACGDCTCHKKKKDDIDDIEVKFSKAELSAVIGDVPSGSVVDVEVYGQLLDGTPFVAHDCVVVQRPNSFDPE